MSELKFTDFEASMKACGYTPDQMPDVSKLPDKHKKAIEAFWKLIVNAEANKIGDEEIDFTKTNWKYAPWFYIEKDDKKPSGFGLSGTHCGSWATDTTVGSRLSFLGSQKAKNFGNQFKELYEDMFFVPQVKPVNNTTENGQ